MKKRKPRDRGSAAERQPSDANEAGGVMRRVERKPFRSSATGPPLGSEPAVMMSGRGGNAKPRGRLDRAVLAMLGKGLRNCFDEVRRQEVPERFKLLLQQFDPPERNCAR
jgi:Anti-sigma factor NepR